MNEFVYEFITKKNTKDCLNGYTAAVLILDQAAPFWTQHGDESLGFATGRDMYYHHAREIPLRERYQYEISEYQKRYEEIFSEMGKYVPTCVIYGTMPQCYHQTLFDAFKDVLTVKRILNPKPWDVADTKVFVAEGHRIMRIVPFTGEED